MKWLIICLILLVSLNCGGKDNSPRSGIQSVSKRQQVQDKLNLYSSLSKTQQDADGFVEWRHCDSLLFSGLYGIAGTVQITAARDANGMWHRRSLNQPECYDPNSPNSSTISRDMTIGLLWWVWEHKRLDVAQDLFKYGQDHNWIIGQGDPSKIYFTPGLQATLAEIIYRLGGENKIVYRSIPQVYSKNIGFASHLDILGILLRAELLGEIESNGLDIVKYNYNRNPKNGLFAYAYHRYTDGDQNEAMDALINESWFPKDRLPTSHDRCEAWLWQRDGGDDWLPCGLDQPADIHSGGDYLFLAALVLRS